VPSGVQNEARGRSVGVKLLVVCTLALFMTIPAAFVGSLVQDRTQRARTVLQEIGGRVGGPQTFLGPTLLIPYRVAPQAEHAITAGGTYVVFPSQASGGMKTQTEDRHRSLFKVPVFKADLNLAAAFDLTGVPSGAPPGAELDWSRAEIVVGVSNAKGALADATLTIDGKVSTLVPARIAPDITVTAEPYGNGKLALFGAGAGDLAKPNARFQVESRLQFSGAQRIAVLAYGRTTHLSAEGDWPTPSFDGGFLPLNRSLPGNGFRAEWFVPFMARNVRSEGLTGTLAGLDATSLGVSFIEVADHYQAVNRSLKYALLFVGLVFLSFFVFEITAYKRLHPAQYVLVGIAQTIFYLLLLSLAERVGFDFGFLVAGAATVLLLSANAQWVFASRAQGIRALAVFTLLYGLIYMLLRLEDNALLAGAIASFAAVAAAMYFTRGIDWYSSLPGHAPERQA
jgi:inner membrane protein